MSYAKESLKDAREALSVAKLLREQQAIEFAIEVAEVGLKLEGLKSELGDWLCDLAESRSDQQLALSAVITDLATIELL